MAVGLIVTASPVSAASRYRGNPRRLVRGINRTLVRKTVAKLIALRNADQRELVRASTMMYPALVLTGDAGSMMDSAFNIVLQRLQILLLLKEGDE